VLAPHLAATSPARKRFLREARSSARVRHENVVQVHAVEEQPLPYLVMEFIPGETLQQRLDRTGPLETWEVVEIGRQIAEGLAAAHHTGLIHRDIKPGNILLEAVAGGGWQVARADRESSSLPATRHPSPTTHVKITDFGLARAADEASMSQSGIVAGTPMFMSPEQARGEPIDYRTDLFSLGSVLYTMASGRTPFRAPGILAVLKRVAEDTPRPISEIHSEVPPWLCDIIARLHAKRPEDRFYSARDVADLLARCQAEMERGGVDLASRGHEPPEVARSSADLRPQLARKKRLWIAAAVVLLLGILGLGVTEATGVTQVRGTVIRLFSPDGTLVVEVDDPGVSVTLDGEDLSITGTGAKEIRLKPGQYKVKASKDGRTVCEDLVRVERNGKQVVRISREANPGKVNLDAAEWEKSVALLPAEGQVKAVRSRLKQLNPHFDGNLTPTLHGGVVRELKLSVEGVKDISPVRVFTELTSLDCSGRHAPMRESLSDLSPLRGMKLTALNCEWTQVSDLSPLKDMPLTTLVCSGAAVTDLAPVQGMRLKLLHCDNTQIADLSPLRGMPLTVLNCSYTQVSSLGPLEGMPLFVLWCNNTQLADLSPLKGMRLQWITVHNTKVSDLSPLRGMRLSQIYLDFEPKRDGEVLRSFKTLQKINDKPAAEFWKEVDQE
jgi:Leucine-rich repeat (LRR) protein